LQNLILNAVAAERRMPRISRSSTEELAVQRSVLDRFKDVGRTNAQGARQSIGGTPPSLVLVYLVKTKTPQVIRVPSPPANERRKQRVIALLKIAVEGIASNRFHPQPGMQCSWCQFKPECLRWLPGQALPERKVA
jgi:hypothetical protein